MSGTSGSYNAVTWLLDRNVDEGRGAKLAFTDTVSELTYGDLQRQSRRVANMLRRLGVRREERVAMIMLDTIDFPFVFLGAIRAGIVPVPLNTLLTSDQYAYVLADCRARVLFVSEALYARREGHRRADARSRARRGVRQGRARPQEALRRARARERYVRDRARPMPRSRHSGSIRPAPPACPRACGICIPICRRPRIPMPARCSASARTMSVSRRQNCSSPMGSATR